MMTRMIDGATMIIAGLAASVLFFVGGVAAVGIILWLADLATFVTW